MADETVIQNLLSGAVGAILATLLTYFVQRQLSLDSKKEDESRVAYVHLTKVTSLVAVIEICIVLLSPLKKITDNKLDEIRIQTGKDIHIAEYIAAVFHVYLNHEERESLDTQNILTQKLGILRETLRELLDFNLSSEQLSKLPKETVISYQLFAGLSSGLKRALEYLLDIAAGKIIGVDEEALLKDDLVHFVLDTILMLDQLHKQIIDLRNQLRDYGKIDKNEADRMLKILRGFFARTYLNQEKAKEHLKVAVIYMENLYAKRNADKESEKPPVN